MNVSGTLNTLDHDTQGLLFRVSIVVERPGTDGSVHRINALATMDVADRDRVTAFVAAHPEPNHMRSLRERLGISQGEAARRMGCSAASWCRWENGDRRPLGVSALDIATVLGVAPAELGVEWYGATRKPVGPS